MPAFMPVGTQGTVKGLTVEQLRATGAQMILANTYHLALRPGEEVVAALGGLHAFIGLGRADPDRQRRLSALQPGATHRRSPKSRPSFRSHIDGTLFELSPERAVAIQEALGSDVAMVLDHVVALPNDAGGRSRRHASASIRWAAPLPRGARRRSDQALFAIVQGGLDPELRVACARAAGGAGFSRLRRRRAERGRDAGRDVSRCWMPRCRRLPADRPRYLMGVGRPEDLLEAIRRGIDLFDCVMPTRNGRNAMAFTDAGPLRLRNLQYERDRTAAGGGLPVRGLPPQPRLLRHLFMAGEMLGPMLLSIHNLTYYQRLLAAARAAIRRETFVDWLPRNCGVGKPRSREPTASGPESTATCPCPFGHITLR